MTGRRAAKALFGVAWMRRLNPLRLLADRQAEGASTERMPEAGMGDPRLAEAARRGRLAWLAALVLLSGACLAGPLALGWGWTQLLPSAALALLALAQVVKFSFIRWRTRNLGGFVDFVRDAVRRPPSA